jgi:hypothetical protein
MFTRYSEVSVITNSYYALNNITCYGRMVSRIKCLGNHMSYYNAVAVNY